MLDVSKYQQMIDDSTPGKLEGECPATAYYYEAMMDGDGEIVTFGDLAEAMADPNTIVESLDGNTTTVFKVSDEQREAFKLSDPYFEIWITEQGFVMGGEVTQAQYDKATN